MIALKTKLVRSFEDWWSSLPESLRKKTRQGDEGNKPLLNQINYILVHNNLKKKGYLNPSYEELISWIKSGQIEITRIS